MRLFVGLGNPGSRYAGNRHNIGFMVVDAIAKRHGIAPWRRRFQGVAVEGPLGGERVLLLLPGTYMNDSGRAVAEAAHFYKLGLPEIVVFPGTLKLPADESPWLGTLTLITPLFVIAPPSTRICPPLVSTSTVPLFVEVVHSPLPWMTKWPNDSMISPA